MIEQNIIRIIPSWADVGEDQKNNFDFVQKQNPAWKQIIFTDDEAWKFVTDHYDDRILSALNRIDRCYGAAVSDFLRYLILNKLGGVYLDNKSGVSRPLDEIVRPDDEYIIFQWDKQIGKYVPGAGKHDDLVHIDGGEYINWVIISRAGHPFLAAVIERVISNIGTYTVRGFGVGKIGTLRTTGPIAMTLAIAEIKHSHLHRMVHCSEAGLLYAADGNGSKHIISSKLHYSHLCHPVVKSPNSNSVIIRFLRGAQMKILMGVARIKQRNRRRIYYSRIKRGRGGDGAV